MLEDDGHFLPEIKRHSLEKIRRHNYYAAIFSKAMSRKWPQRAYVGLYSGSGRARLADTGDIVETSAISVLRQEVPFTKYIFVDSDPRCVQALQARINDLGGDFDVTIIQGDVNESVSRVIAAMPRFGPGHGLLSLCFIDPYRADLDFSVIKRLAQYRMDFLVMLPFGYDARRNLTRYLEDDQDDRIGRLIDDSDWRAAWKGSVRPSREFIRFLIERFDAAMARLGYDGREMRDTVDVRAAGMGVFLYALALYSQHEKGQEFWRTTLAGVSAQLDLGI